MQISVKGKLNEEKIKKAVEKARKLIKFPKNIEIYFLENAEYCDDIIATLHKHLRGYFRQVCLVEKSSFSFNHMNRNLVVLSLEKKKSVVNNQKALIGLILHELMHSIQVKKGEYKNIYEGFDETFKKNKKLLKKLKYPSKKISVLFDRIGFIAIMLLKDLFCNSELIGKGYGSYLLEYYKSELKGKKSCPRPVFYDKFKDAAKKDPEIIQDAFDFEFSLLSIILPFQKYRTDESLILMKHIDKCYEINIHEISRKCHELIYLYLNYYKPNKEFSKRFLNAIFNKVYMLLV